MGNELWPCLINFESVYCQNEKKIDNEKKTTEMFGLDSVSLVGRERKRKQNNLLIRYKSIKSVSASGTRNYRNHIEIF